ncbi:hypothetical protein PS865_04490 [Pseudomonas fluorescens]|uniref:integrase n=1 Tax=Pseudomonas fluorescens TaxID=294 RepID=UPI00124303B1|nr:integrase [Pseudomonas fluorescens]VVP33545.1 hypothetical protein PS865_04490 [Pseudomonas fluorescens]
MISATTSLSVSNVTSQPGDVRGLSEVERDALVISAAQVDGHWVILSRFGDNIWHTDGFSTNTPASSKLLKFETIPPAFRLVMKEMMYRYLRRGRMGKDRPEGRMAVKFLVIAALFLRYLEALNLDRVSSVTPMVCATYADVCKAHRQTRSKGKPLSGRGLQDRFAAVEAVHELSQYTHDPMPQHPWIETSALAMAGLVGNGAPRTQGSKTPLIPDDIFCTLFERACQQVKQGNSLLDLRDALSAKTGKVDGLRSYKHSRQKDRDLKALGWDAGPVAYNSAMKELRTACYIILASTSGCRNHELANVQSGAHLRTEDDDGTIFHWMRSRSDKTDTGKHDWMIPELGVRVLRMMERWSAPFQAKIAAEIELRRRANPHDPQITEAQKHRHALFLATGDEVRTLTSSSWGENLKSFARNCGLTWNLTSHQFRRKFANYAAHSRFGDLRYLKEHFAHWTLDMSLGYAMDDSWGKHLDLELYGDIEMELEAIKFGVVDAWLKDETLAGGYGGALKHWQREPQNLNLFKDHAAMLKSIAESTAIRSNGHAWCTADDSGCIGNTLERSRCGDNCSNAIIGRIHQPIYQRLYDDHKELKNCTDIGEAGRQRVQRDMGRYREVLIKLGIDSEALIA